MLRNNLLKWPKALRVSLLLLGVLALFVIGDAHSPLFYLLNSLYRSIAAVLGKEGPLLTHGYPYRIVYCALCLFIIHIYFSSWEKTRLVLGMYLVTFVLCLLLVKLGKSMGGMEMAYRTGAQLIGIMVSPFPVALMIPALHLIPNNESVNEQIKSN